MSVYKEGFTIIKMIDGRSARIFDDAADYGAPFKVGDELFNAVKQLVNWYQAKGSKVERWDGADQKTAKVVVSLIDEWDTGKTMYFVIEANYCPELMKKPYSNYKWWDGFINMYRVDPQSPQQKALEAIEDKWYDEKEKREVKPNLERNEANR